MSSWEWFNGNNNACVMMSSKDGSSLTIENLISPSYNLSAYSKPAIKFKYTGAAVNTFPTNEVSVYYTTDCGNNWAFLGKLTNLHVARAGLYTSNYAPNGDWQDTVMTKNALKNDNVQFKFEYSNNGASNNFYLDDIEIGEEDNLLKDNIEPLTRINVFPNPSLGDVNIVVSNVKDRNLTVTLVDILGNEVKNVFEGQAYQNNIQITTNLNSLDKGIYFINVSEGNTILNIDKLILNK